MCFVLAGYSLVFCFSLFFHSFSYFSFIYQMREHSNSWTFFHFLWIFVLACMNLFSNLFLKKKSWTFKKKSRTSSKLWTFQIHELSVKIMHFSPNLWRFPNFCELFLKIMEFFIFVNFFQIHELFSKFMNLFKSMIVFSNSWFFIQTKVFFLNLSFSKFHELFRKVNGQWPGQRSMVVANAKAKTSEWAIVQLTERAIEEAAF